MMEEDDSICTELSESRKTTENDTGMHSKELLKNNQPLFRDLNADDSDPEVSEIDSLCVNCLKSGTTRILLTKIPHYQEVILMSFSCPHCNYSNNEIQSGGKIRPKGVIYKLHVQKQQDLDRQVVKSDSAVLTIPELRFEIPAGKQKGEITTVEGIIKKAVTDLELSQEERRIANPDVAQKIEDFTNKLRNLATCNQAFHMVLTDPSGNSFIENPRAPHKDENMIITWFKRSQEQNRLLGITTEDESDSEPQQEPLENPEDEVLTFATNCYQCNSPCETNMKVVDIPHFKQVVIMASVCDVCGYKSTEVKGGAGIEPKGTRIELRISNINDMKRDLLKSDTCSVIIPELEFELQSGSLGGKFTTLEGLLVDIKEELLENNPFCKGDTPTADLTQKLKDFASQLDKIISCEMPVHIILDDPAGNSYLQNIYAPDEDVELEIVHYERSPDQNEVLGLNDLLTENYQTVS